MNQEYEIGTGKHLKRLVPWHRNVYVNVGCWCAGRTDFSVVHGGEVALFSWMNFLGEEEGNILIHDTAEYNDIEEVVIKSDKIKAFREPQRAKSYLGKPRLLAYTRLPDHHYRDKKKFLFTDIAASPYVFIGDLHLSLFRETPLDAFTVTTQQLQDRDIQPEADRHLHSQAPFFKNFVDYLSKAHGILADHVIQCGDCFEVWIPQLIFDMGHDFVLEQGDDEISVIDRYERTMRSVYRPGVRRAETGGYTTTVPVVTLLSTVYSDRKAFNEWLGFDARRWWHSRATIQEALLLALNQVKDEEEFFALWIDLLNKNRKQYDHHIDFLDVSKVEKAIKEVHPELNATWDKLTVTRGNHDTIAENAYLSLRYRGKWSEYAVKTGWVKRDIPGDGSLQRTGLDNSIVYEHGNRFDEYNNDKNYFRHRADYFTQVTRAHLWNLFGIGNEVSPLIWKWDAGFRKTGNYIGDIMQGSVIWKMTQDWLANDVFESLVVAAQDLKEYFYDPENYETGSIRLVVLGHTHVPELENKAAEKPEPEPVPRPTPAPQRMPGPAGGPISDKEERREPGAPDIGAAEEPEPEPVRRPTPTPEEPEPAPRPTPTPQPMPGPAGGPISDEEERREPGAPDVGLGRRG